MTSIDSGQDLAARRLAQQRASEMAASLLGVSAQPAQKQDQVFASKIQTSAAAASNAVTGVMQPPLSSPTVTALLSATNTQQNSGPLSESANSKQYAHISDDEQGLSTAAKDFLDYNRKTPAEKMRDSILKEEGLTEEDLSKMDPKQRDAVEQKIAAKIKERMKEEMEKTASGSSGSSSAAAEGITSS
jgi:hypothetical protein